MSRIIILTGLVGTEPEARHGKNADYVKIRLGTQEPGEKESWWFNVYCYGKNAKTVLEKVKVGDNLYMAARLLPPLTSHTTNDLSIEMLDFKWLPRQEQRRDQNINSSNTEEFSFESFDDIPEIPID